MAEPRYYLSPEREHEYGYRRIIDRLQEDTPAYEGAHLYSREYEVCYVREDADAAWVLAALNAAPYPAMVVIDDPIPPLTPERHVALLAWFEALPEATKERFKVTKGQRWHASDLLAEFKAEQDEEDDDGHR